jgi:hypothetical protein
MPSGFGRVCGTAGGIGLDVRVGWGVEVRVGARVDVGVRVRVGVGVKVGDGVIVGVEVDVATSSNGWRAAPPTPRSIGAAVTLAATASTKAGITIVLINSDSQPR